MEKTRIKTNQTPEKKGGKKTSYHITIALENENCNRIYAPREYEFSTKKEATKEFKRLFKSFYEEVASDKINQRKGYTIEAILDKDIYIYDDESNNYSFADFENIDYIRKDIK